jgi:uncharacterized protein (DUF362 family)
MMKSLNQPLTRRELLRLMAAGGAAAVLAACTNQTPTPRLPTRAPLPTQPPAAKPGPTETASQPSATAVPPTSEPAGQPLKTNGGTYLAVARGADPTAITKAAVAALGGIETFVKKGADVIIKPNICVAYHSYEYAATTNPQVVAALVALCLGAGAKRVRVMDFPFGGTCDQAYKATGIEDAVKAAGGEMHPVNYAKFVTTDIPNGRDLKSYMIYEEALKSVVINVPIAKHHSLARLTLGGKNMMGLIMDRDSIHGNMGQRIADLLSVIKPAFTLVDAVRILMDNGPTGGDLNDVKLTNTVIASADTVAADAYATTLFGLKGEDISYIGAAAKMGLGTMDLSAIKKEEINL